MHESPTMLRQTATRRLDDLHAQMQRDHEERMALSKRHWWAVSGFSDHHRALAESGLPRHDKFEAAIKSGIERISQGGIIVLLGPWGCGKTQMSCCWGRDAIFTGHMPAKYYRTMDLMGDYRGQVFNGAEKHSAWIHRHAGRGLLVLDEYEKRGGSEFEQTVLSNLIDIRHTAADKPTVLISNLLRGPFADLARPDVMDRINARGVVIECRWPSFRIKDTIK